MLQGIDYLQEPGPPRAGWLTPATLGAAALS